MAQYSKQPQQQMLGSLPMAIALDKSGSTYGKTLKTEIQVVEELCRLRFDTNKAPVHLLPWSGEALDPIKLPDDTEMMMQLQGEGLTDPSVLYSSDDCLAALKSCGIWFLLTDGQIYDSLVENFAVKTNEVCLQGTPCVIIVFGDASRSRPAASNISVGIAIYAVVPDCLFLFHDIPTGIVRVMQAKGKFKELLPTTGHDQIQPVVTKYTAWSELPRFSYQSLSGVGLNEARQLKADELQLQGGAVVKLSDLLSGKTDPGTVEQIMKDDDNLKSIVLASMTRGTGKDVEAWLQAQQMPLPKRTNYPRDIGGRAQRAIDNLLEALRFNAPADELSNLRAEARSAHENNLKEFCRTFNDEMNAEMPYRKMNNRLRQGVIMNKLKRRNAWEALNVGNDLDEPDTHESTLMRERDNADGLDVVCLPGFRRRKPVSEYRGQCMLCHSTSVLTLLLKSPPRVTTENFPREGTYAKLAFPLAMGNFAEMDLLSFFVCCDACAFHLQRVGVCPYKDTIIGALCLVCVGSNQATWLEGIDQAVRGRFDISDLLSICVAIIDKKLVENEVREASLEEKQLFRGCGQWAIRNLAQITEIPSTLSAAFGNEKEAVTKTTLSSLLSTDHFASPGNVDNVDLLLLRYPIPGFMALLRLLSLLYVQPDQMQTLLFQRVLFHVTELYISKKRSGDLQLPTMNQIGKVDIPVSELLSHDLLDPESLQLLRNQAEFEAIERQSGPAMAVFLHHLLTYGQVYPTPMACFNALKVSTTMKKVILMPLAISPGLAADLISQM